MSNQNFESRYFKESSDSIAKIAIEDVDSAVRNNGWAVACLFIGLLLASLAVSTSWVLLLMASISIFVAGVLSHQNDASDRCKDMINELRSRIDALETVQKPTWVYPDTDLINKEVL